YFLLSAPISSLFFCFMILPTPRSTLFPYTTLFRSLYDDALAPIGLGANQFSIMARLSLLGPTPIQDLARVLVMDRSTLGHLLRPDRKSTRLNSSHQINIVCRLLLEKKKNNNH